MIVLIDSTQSRGRQHPRDPGRFAPRFRRRSFSMNWKIFKRRGWMIAGSCSAITWNWRWRRELRRSTIPGSCPARWTIEVIRGSNHIQQACRVIRSTACLTPNQTVREAALPTNYIMRSSSICEKQLEIVTGQFLEVAYQSIHDIREFVPGPRE
jgi:hypothetical protein